MNTFEEVKKIKWIMKQIISDSKRENSPISEAKVAYFEDENIDSELENIMVNFYTSDFQDITILIAKMSNYEMSIYLSINEKDTFIEAFRINESGEEHDNFLQKIVKIEETREYVETIYNFFVLFDSIKDDFDESPEENLKTRLKIVE
jgi:hypothetical protein